MPSKEYKCSYYRRNRERILAQNKALYHANPEHYRNKTREDQRKYRSDPIKAERERERARRCYHKWRSNPDWVQRRRESSKRGNAKRRLQVLTHYGDNPPHCACCLERKLEFLTLDHINGGGTKHRLAVQRKSGSFYKWITVNNFPEGFRVLCMNCNISLGQRGYCPHNRQIDIAPPEYAGLTVREILT